MNERIILPELKEWFDERLQGLDPYIIKNDPIKMLILAALACLGIAEEGGDNRGKLVSMFQATIGSAVTEPWCLSYLQSCIAYVETFGFKSKLYPTEHCITLWGTSDAACGAKVPKAGDIVVWQHGTTYTGHCGLILECMPKAFTTIEGNTGPGVGIVRDGDGVYKKTRLVNSSRVFTVLGYLRPF